MNKLRAVLITTSLLVLGMTLKPGVSSACDAEKKAEASTDRHVKAATTAETPANPESNKAPVATTGVRESK